MKKYHAHIYFDLKDLDLAELLFQKVKAKSEICRPWKIYNRPVGPHPKPMLELHFQSQTRDHVVAWLKENLGSWSALVHEDSGDDYRDHTEGHLWLGPELPIDFGFFQLIQQDPTQAIHQN